MPIPNPEFNGLKIGPLGTNPNINGLKILNLTYDITPAKFITMVACDDGLIPSTLVLSVLRDQLKNNKN